MLVGVEYENGFCTRKLDSVECVNVSQNKDTCRVVMKVLKESWAPESTRKFLSKSRVIRF
jgi:hypothetical protein